jgi:hypothetical protein
MPDIWNEWGSDLVLGPRRDLLAVDGSEATRQRVLRRLLSNPTDLIFNPDYGAGLPSRIGELLETAALDGAVRAQMSAEAGVSQDPAPEVTTTPFSFGATVVVQYRDRNTDEFARISQ